MSLQRSMFALAQWRDSDRDKCPSKGRAGDTRVYVYNFVLGE